MNDLAFCISLVLSSSSFFVVSEFGYRHSSRCLVVRIVQVSRGHKCMGNAYFSYYKEFVVGN